MSKFSRTVVLTVIALIIIPQIAHAGWWRTFGGPSGDGANWVEITSDNSYIFCGAGLVSEPYYGTVGYILKINQVGDIVWTRAYDMKVEELDGVDCQFRCVQQTTQDQGYILVGSGWEPHIPPLFSKGALLLKTDSLGDSLWARHYGGEADDWGRCVRQTTDGGYIMTGWTKSYGAGENDIWVLRTDSLGDTLWTLTHGGEESDYGYCVRQTSDGNYVVVGSVKTAQGKVICLLNIDDEGSLLWDRTYGGTSKGFSIQETADGGFIISGSTYADSSVYLLKTDSAGDSLWSHSYTRRPGCKGNCVEQTTDRGYIIAAVSHYFPMPSHAHGWLIKTDSLGDTLWTRTLILTPVGDNSLNCVHQTADGGYIIAGRTGNAKEDWGFQMWFIKTDSLGDTLSGITEKPAAEEPGWDVASSIGSKIVLRYVDYPQGLHVSIFDASGQKVGEIHSTETAGTIEWGQDQQAGVYFIRQVSGSPSVRKVVLVR